MSSFSDSGIRREGQFGDNFVVTMCAEIRLSNRSISGEIERERKRGERARGGATYRYHSRCSVNIPFEIGSETAAPAEGRSSNVFSGTFEHSKGEGVVDDIAIDIPLCFKPKVTDRVQCVPWQCQHTEDRHPFVSYNSYFINFPHLIFVENGHLRPRKNSSGPYW